jgi:hypothetical protein
MEDRQREAERRARFRSVHFYNHEDVAVRAEPERTMHPAVG